MVVEFHDDHPHEFCHHHEGCWPFCRFLVPPHQGGTGRVDLRAQRPFHHASEQQRQAYHETSGLKAFWFLQEQTIDNHWIFEKPVVLLRAMLVFVDGEEVMGAMGHVTRRGHIGAQHEAARFFLHADDALCLGLNGRVQLIAHGFDRPWLVTAGPALHGDVHLMVSGAAIRILIFDGPELPAAKAACYDVSLFPQAQEEGL